MTALALMFQGTGSDVGKSVIVAGRHAPKGCEATRTDKNFGTHVVSNCEF